MSAANCCMVTPGMSLNMATLLPPSARVNELSTLNASRPAATELRRSVTVEPSLWTRIVDETPGPDDAGQAEAGLAEAGPAAPRTPVSATAVTAAPDRSFRMWGSPLSCRNGAAAPKCQGGD